MSGAMLPRTRAEAGSGVRRNGSTADGWLPVKGIALLATPGLPTPEYLPVLGSGTVRVGLGPAHGAASAAVPRLGASPGRTDVRRMMVTHTTKNTIGNE